MSSNMIQVIKNTIKTDPQAKYLAESIEDLL